MILRYRAPGEPSILDEMSQRLRAFIADGHIEGVRAELGADKYSDFVMAVYEKPELEGMFVVGQPFRFYGAMIQPGRNLWPNEIRYYVDGLLVKEED